MRKFIGITTAAVLTISAIAAWGNVPAGTESVVDVEVRIDPSELTKTVRDLPVQFFDAF